jgi:ArsR family transcriptional regulator, lead/cadmium/zinc/bismuth-responsive transcriptional repressor
MSLNTLSKDQICEPALHKPPLDERPLINDKQARDLEGLFKILANTTRLRILHALKREPDLYVSELAQRIGMKPQAVSNQLQRLVDRNILDYSPDGNRVRYQIVDPCVWILLERGLCLNEETRV